MSEHDAPSNKPAQDIQSSATEGGGESSPASSLSDIQDFEDSLVSEFAVLHTDEATLPASALERQRTFETASELREYLLSGGLMGTTGPNNDPVALGWVHVLKITDPADSDIYHYTVHIPEDSE